LVLVLAAFLSGQLEWLELQALNSQFDLRGARAPRTPLVIVSIEEDSFDELDLAWPWPRALHGRLLDALRPGQPAAIGLDILFPEPSSRGPADDEALAQAVGRAGNVVLAAAQTVVSQASFVKEDLNPPIRPIRDGAAGFGTVNFGFDSDGFVRSGLLALSHQDAEVPSFDRELHRLAVAAGVPSAPLPTTTAVLINYRGGPKTFPTVPYYRILAGEVGPEEFTGKIVLVGATSPTLHDIFPTPFARHGMAGVEIHANILETLFQGLALARVPRAVTGGLLVLAGVLALWLTNRAAPLLALGLILGAGLAHAAAGFAAFAWGNLWVDQVPVPLALALGYGGTLVESYMRAQREKRRLARFFSPAVLREIVRHGSELGRSRRVITVLFSDIRGFTPISEKLSPEEIAELLREYMTSMTEIVFKHGGTVTQFVGDEIMALYNAPFDQADHAVQAVHTALEFQERVKELSKRWEVRCGSPLRTGVGINTGPAVVGVIGSAQRVEYGAIGDTINLGSRLEGLTKEFATAIIIGDTTYQLAKDLFQCRSLGEVSVKGKSLPVKIYGVEGLAQRRAQRVTVAAPLTITEAIGELRVSVPASLSDLSVTGLRATELPKPLTAGQVVGLRFDLPGLPRPITISTEGRVMRAGEDQAGIRFLDLGPENERLIEAFLKSHADRPGA
jgi:adenylate cyclase